MLILTNNVRLTGKEVHDGTRCFNQDMLRKGFLIRYDVSVHGLVLRAYGSIPDSMVKGIEEEFGATFRNVIVDDGKQIATFLLPELGRD